MARPVRQLRSVRLRERGMTLVEVLVVLVILALLASFAVPRLMQYVGGARSDTAALQIKRLAGILELYRLQNGGYPSTQDGLGALLAPPAGAERWNGPYLQNAEALIDPWGTPYVYRSPGQNGEYDLLTLGADGRAGGDGEDADVANLPSS
ncbi:MAG: type II secretion system major pseudopilin GspG [Pseudomonadota bacterium]